MPQKKILKGQSSEVMNLDYEMLGALATSKAFTSFLWVPCTVDLPLGNIFGFRWMFINRGFYFKICFIITIIQMKGAWVVGPGV